MEIHGISCNNALSLHFSLTNCHLYHYAGNNPVRYVDPDGWCAYSNFIVMEMEYKIEYNKSQTEIFVKTLRACIGADYSHLRMPTSSEMDCSGMLVYALDKMGYEVPSDVTANKIANKEYDWIIMLDKVDNSRQGESGMLNLYKFGRSKVVHVNYGVGKCGTETTNQIIDASEGDTWQSIRNLQDNQNPKAEENKINKTWAPFSTKSFPDYQAIIDFTKLKRKEVTEE